MRAAQIIGTGGSEVIEIIDMAEPVVGDGEILVDCAAIGVNPIDWKLREGLFPLPRPYIPGQDVAGTVVAVGTGVSEFAVGDRVMAMTSMRGPGTYAERIALPAAMAAKVPDSLSLLQAAAVPMAALTAWMGIADREALIAGMRVLVHGGAGAVGAMAIQFAKAAGCWVATTASARTHDRVAALGPDRVIDYRTARFEDDLGGDERVDFVLDTIGGDTCARSWAVIRDGGSLASMLAPPMPPEMDAVRGVRGLPMIGVQPDGKMLGIISRCFGSGLRHPHIGPIFALEEAAKAMDASQHGRVDGKVMLRTGTDQ